MNPVAYLKKNGIRRAWDVVYRYKIDLVLQKILAPFLKKRPLRDIIVIESHNDFDSNGGAFYHYLIENGYNRTHRIVWLLKHPEAMPKALPKNVDWAPLYRPSLKKNYYRWMAKWFTADNDCHGKLRDDQISIYFGHGGFGLKQWKGYISLPDRLDYIAMPSRAIGPLFADQFMLKADDPRLCYIGFPYVDAFYSDAPGDLSKITDEEYKKTVLWMPTFRVGGGYKREDGREGALGIPLVQSMEEYEELNEALQSMRMLLVIKLHPMQDLSRLAIHDLSNIRVLTAASVKKLGVDNYRLMKDCDAMISDYSSAAFDFLHTNRPAAFDLSDADEYKIGLVEDTRSYIYGKTIVCFDDLKAFLREVSEGRDECHALRQEVRKKIFDHYDGENCRRAAELLGIAPGKRA